MMRPTSGCPADACFSFSLRPRVATALKDWPDHPKLPESIYVQWDEEETGQEAGPIANLAGDIGS